VRVWARARVLPRRVRARRVPRLTRVPHCYEGRSAFVLRDAAWLEWRFVEAPRPYTLLDGGDGYAVVGRRGRLGVVAAVCGGLLADAAAASRAPALIAAPPPWERKRYALAGYVPTHRTFTVLGKALDRAQRVPERPHFELGDLDFL